MTKDNGQEVNVGDIAVRKSFTMRGRVILNDGKSIPPDMRISATYSRGDSLTVNIGPDGAFEIKGLQRGVYTIVPAVRGYEPNGGDRYLETLVEGETNNFNIVMRPQVKRN